MSETPMAYHAGLPILVVDDHPPNRDIIIEQLHALGVQTIAVANGPAALETINEQSVALVLMDCHMPDMDGYETTQRIRQREEALGLPRVPVIAISAAADASHLKRCMDSGMDSVLRKPLRAGELAATLGLWLGWRTPTPPGRKLGVAEPPSEAMLDLYKAAIAEDAKKLQEAFAQGRVEDVARLAHRIRGAALMVHAHDMAHAAAQVEEMAGVARDPVVARAMHGLQKEIDHWIAMRRH